MKIDPPRMYSAHLLAQIKYVGAARVPVLHSFVVRSEDHANITTDWKRGCYATLLSVPSENSFSHAVQMLRELAEKMMPTIAEMVEWR